jgi:hypothetical protein
MESFSPFRQKTGDSLILMQERGDSGVRDRSSSVLIIAQGLQWTWRGGAAGATWGGGREQGIGSKGARRQRS